MNYLKQSTTVTIKLGPFLDPTDGVTEETALTPGIEVAKNGGSFASRNSATAVSHDAEGYYDVELDATDTNTLGILIVKAHDSSNHLPVWKELSVVTANIYDSLFSTDTLEVDVVAISADTTAANNLELDYDGTGYNKSASTIGTATNVTNTVNLSSTTETQIDNIEADTNEIQGKLPTNNIMGSSVTTDKDDEIDAIKSKTDQLTFTTANKVDSRVDNWAGTAVTLSATTNKPEVDAASISDDATAANNLESDYDGTGYNKSASTIGTATNVTNTVNLSGTTEAQIDAIETDTNEIQGKLPTNFIMGSSDQTDLNDDIVGIQSDLDNATDGLGALKALIDTVDSVVDAIKLVTDNLPNSGALNDLATLASRLTAARAGYLDTLNTGVTLTSATETQIDNIEGYVDDIQGDVTTSLNTYDPPTRTELTSDKDEIIAGQSSGGTTPAAIWGYAGTRSLNVAVDLQTATQNSIDAIETDTNEIQGKLPTNYIMGSSDQSNLDDDIIGIQTDLSNATDGLGALKTLLDTIDTVVDGIKLVTDNLPNSGALNDLATLASRLTAARAGYLDALNTGVPLSAATESQIDAIETDTNEIQGKLPTGDIADESNVETHVTNSLNAYDPPTRTELTSDKNEILAGQVTNEITPANIWGYASRSLTDPVDLQTATQASIDAIEGVSSQLEGKLPVGAISDFNEATDTVNLSATTEAQIDAIETDTNEIQGKLPTNYIMGSSDQSNLDDDIIGIQTDLSNATDGLGALKTLLDTIDTVIDGIKLVTDNLPNSGALNDLATLASRLTAARAGYLDALNTGVPLSAATETQIDNIDTTINKLDDTLEDDGGTYRFTTNALEQGPSGTVNISSVDIESINGYNVTKNTANNMVSFFDVANTSDIEDIAEMKRMIQSKSG